MRYSNNWHSVFNVFISDDSISEGADKVVTAEINTSSVLLR